MLIPAYQQPLLRSETFENGRITKHTFEAIAARLRHTRPTNAAVESIYKTEVQEQNGNAYTLNVTASSFRTELRVDYVPKRGNDGNMHNVPVEWIEYIPIKKISTMRVVPENELTEIPQHAIRYQGFIAFPL